MNEYSKTCLQARTFNEENDCSVKAIAIVSGLSYSECHSLYRKHGRKNKKGTPIYITHKVLEDLGCSIDYIKPKKENGSKYTLRTIGKAYPKGDYIIITNNHMVALCDGVIEDWASNSCKRVIRLYPIRKE